MKMMLTMLIVCTVPFVVYCQSEASHEYLQNGKWQSGDGFDSLLFSLQNGEYVFQWYGYESGASGTYRISGDAIHFSGKEGEEVEQWQNRTATLFISQSNFNYSDGLEFEKGYTMWNTNSVVPPGSERMYKGTPVVLIKNNGVTNDGVKIRTGPSTSDASVLFTDFTDYVNGRGPKKELAYMPKGVELMVIARTKDKETVESWFNYWYLVQVAVDFKAAFGYIHEWYWAFGEFIDIPKS